jgi:hypothetical protein
MILGFFIIQFLLLFFLAFHEFALRVRVLANYFGRSPALAEQKQHPSRLISDRLLFSEEGVLPKAPMICQEETEGFSKNPIAE